jgi:hypothetical protein
MADQVEGTDQYEYKKHLQAVHSSTMSSALDRTSTDTLTPPATLGHPRLTAWTVVSNLVLEACQSPQRGLSSGTSQPTTLLVGAVSHNSEVSFHSASRFLAAVKPGQWASHPFHLHQPTSVKKQGRDVRWGSSRRLQNNIPRLRWGQLSMWCTAWQHTKQWLVAKNKSASGPVNRDRASNVIQFTAMKTGGEKRDFGKNLTQCVVW